jgi:hypothetical protein
MNSLNLFDPASVAEAKAAVRVVAQEALETLSQETRVGFGPSSIAKVIKAVDETIDRMAEATRGTASIETLKAAQIAALNRFNEDLLKDPSLVKAFAYDTLAGQLFRGLAANLAGLNLLNNGSKFYDKRDVTSGVQLLVAVADFAQKSSEVLRGFKAVADTSLIGKFGGAWRLAGRLSAGEIISMTGSVVEGAVGIGLLFGEDRDIGLGIIQLTSAGGGLLMSTQVLLGTWAGGVGAGIVLAALTARKIYTDVEDTHSYEAASKQFLIDGGYTAAAAEMLSKRIDYSFNAASGSSQMDFLVKYAKAKQIDQARLRDWINGLTPAQIRILSEAAIAAINSQSFETDEPRRAPQWVGPAISRGATYSPAKDVEFKLFERRLDGRNIPHLPNGFGDMPEFR